MRRSYLILGFFLLLLTPLAQATIQSGYNFEVVDGRAFSYAVPGSGTGRMSWNTANYEWLIWLHVNNPSLGKVQLVYSTRTAGNSTAKWDSPHVIQQIDDTQMNNPAWDIAYDNSTNRIYVAWSNSATWDGYLWFGSCNETSRTINWADPKPMLFYHGSTKANHPQWPDVTVSGGHAYVAFTSSDDLYLTKNANSTKGWVTAAGYPKKIADAGDLIHFISPPVAVSLGADDVAVIYRWEDTNTGYPDPLLYRRCVGDTLQAETAICEDSTQYFSAVNYNATAYVSYWNATSVEEDFTTLTSKGLGSPETITGDARARISTLSYDSLSETFYLFGEHSSDIAMWARSSGSWGDATSLGMEDSGIFSDYISSKEVSIGGAMTGFFWAGVSIDSSWVWENSLRAVWTGGASIVGSPIVISPKNGGVIIPGATFNVTWTIPSGNQTAYMVQIGNSGFTDILASTGKMSANEKTTSITAPETAGSYYLRVYYWNEADSQSSASTAKQFYADRLEVYDMGTTETSVTVGTEQTVWAKARREATQEVLGSGVSFVSAGITFKWNAMSHQFEAHPSLDSPGVLTFSSISSVNAPPITSGIVTATPVSITWHNQGNDTGSSSGGSGMSNGTDLTITGVKIEDIDAVAKPLDSVKVNLPISWYGLPEILCVSLDFGEYSNWVYVNSTFPVTVDGANTGSIPIKITPSLDAKEGNYTIVVSGVFSSADYTNMRAVGSIHLTIECTHTAPTTTPDNTGALIGGGVAVALVVAIKRRH